ncbi:unnamed protein product, partial [Brachionus calyciflorus]
KQPPTPHAKFDTVSPETNCGKICKHLGLFGHVQKRSIHCLKNPNKDEIEAVLTDSSDVIPESKIETIFNNNTPKFKKINTVDSFTNKHDRTPDQIKWSNHQQFDAQKNGNLHDQQWVKDEMKNFYKNMDNLQQFYCSNCTEQWPTKNNNCLQCKEYP